MRAFIAIALPEEIRRRIAAFQREWQAGLRGSFIRWTPVEQVHLTLRFLGDVPFDAIPSLEAALRRACDEVPGFELTADGCGCFPGGHQMMSSCDCQIAVAGGEAEPANCVLTNAATGPSLKPRVLWVGVGGAVAAVARLRARLVEETKAWGERETREFRAHLTIGRVKDTPPAVLREIVHRAQTVPCGDLGRWRVEGVRLMRSELSPAGAKHTELCSVAFKR